MRRCILGAAPGTGHGDSSGCHAYSSGIHVRLIKWMIRPAKMLSSLFARLFLKSSHVVDPSSRCQCHAGFVDSATDHSRRFRPTALPGVQVLRASCDVARGPQIYEPSLVIIVQGSKLAYLGPRTLEYGAGHYLIQALPVPFECETFAAPDGPMLGISIAIDRILLGELVLAMGLVSGAQYCCANAGVHDLDSARRRDAWMRGTVAALPARSAGMSGHGARRVCVSCCSSRCAGRKPMCCARWWSSRGNSPGSRHRSVICMRITPSR